MKARYTLSPAQLEAVRGRLSYSTERVTSAIAQRFVSILADGKTVHLYSGNLDPSAAKGEKSAQGRIMLTIPAGITPNPDSVLRATAAILGGYTGKIKGMESFGTSDEQGKAVHAYGPIKMPEGVTLSARFGAPAGLSIDSKQVIVFLREFLACWTVANEPEVKPMTAAEKRAAKAAAKAAAQAAVESSGDKASAETPAVATA
jgi:hypothetical protein